MCEFLNRTLFLHLPAELVQRLDMPEAFAGDGAKGQGAKEVHEKNFRDAEFQSLLKGFQRTPAAPVVDGGQGVAGQGTNYPGRLITRVLTPLYAVLTIM